jgi:hypothetical protein
MRPSISGQHLKSFFQDPHYWGQGQAYENLELVVNGVSIGSPEFDQDWDPVDLKDNDEVIIVGGRLVLEDQAVPRFVAQMAEEWLIARGLTQVNVALPSVKPKAKEKTIVKTQAAARRPSFHL